MEIERTEVMNVMRNMQASSTSLTKLQVSTAGHQAIALDPNSLSGSVSGQPLPGAALDLLAFAAMLLGYAIFALACIS